MMNENLNLIVDNFHRVKNLGFVRSNRQHNTGIGKTFEDYMNVSENNLDAPDLFGFEIKSHRELSNSYITLFTKSPSFPKGANKYLRDNYGVSDENNPELKILHTSMFANKYNTYSGGYSFRLVNDRDNKMINIGVYSNDDEHRLIDKSCGYYYRDIEIKLSCKLKKLFYVEAETKIIEGVEHFHYISADIYEEPTFDKFIDLIDEGLIMYDIRIGSYKSGSKYGKLHDHGSGFRIKESDLSKLYSQHTKI